MHIVPICVSCVLFFYFFESFVLLFRALILLWSFSCLIHCCCCCCFAFCSNDHCHLHHCVYFVCFRPMMSCVFCALPLLPAVLCCSLCCSLHCTLRCTLCCTLLFHFANISSNCIDGTNFQVVMWTCCG